MEREPKELKFNGLRVDPDRRILARDDRQVALTPKVRDLLLLFLANPGRVLSREMILETLWPDTVVTDEALTFQVSELRKALGGLGRLIKTIPKAGYLWEGEGPATIEPEPVAAAPEPVAPEPVAPEPAAPEEPSPAAIPLPREVSLPPRPTRSRSQLAAAVLFGLAAVLLSLVASRSRPEDWVEVFADSFERTELGPSYRVADGTATMSLGGVVLGRTGPANLELVTRYPGNVRLDFEATVLAGSGKAEVAVFLATEGGRSVDAYYVGFGGDLGTAEVDRDGEEVLLVPAPEVVPDRRYRLSVRRRGGSLELDADGQTLLRYEDPVPLGPLVHSVVKLGTYDGFLRIDDLHVYRERVARAVPPTAPGDLLYERGAYEDAVTEYERVRQDQRGREVAGEALYKIGLCRLAAGQAVEAVSAFRAAVSSPASRLYQNLAALGEGEAWLAAGNRDRAFDLLSGLARTTRDTPERIRLAAQLEGLANAFEGAHERRKERRALELVRGLSDVPLAAERATGRLANLDRLETGSLEPLRRLHFVGGSGRAGGKVRYGGLELLGVLQVLTGDVPGALETYTALERAFEGKNARFSLRGLYGQAVCLTLLGRHDEARSLASRLTERLQGDPYPARLLEGFRAFDLFVTGGTAGRRTAREILEAQASLGPEAGPDFATVAREAARLAREDGDAPSSAGKEDVSPGLLRLELLRDDLAQGRSVDRSALATLELEGRPYLSFGEARLAFELALRRR